jgi:hypothetical protein
MKKCVMTLTTTTIVRLIASMATGGMDLRNGLGGNAVDAGLGCSRRAI